MNNSTHKSVWTAFTDGASRGNPGLASCGVFIIAPNGTEHSFKKFLGEFTNNQAEYQALLLALTHLVHLKAQHVVIKADSELMVRQLNGIYRVKNEKILPLFAEAIRLSKQFKTIEFKHIPREQNKEADRLANQAIDERGGF